MASASASACATCAAPFASPIDALAEKPLLPGRDLACCGRSICARCLHQNTRYQAYCPYCQITTEPSSLPQALRDPPAYTWLGGDHGGPPPAYSACAARPVAAAADAKGSQAPAPAPAPDVLHFVTSTDSMNSLALAYGVPVPALRRANHLYSDHLLMGRRTILVPGEYYRAGVSLSPQPPEGEEEEVRRGKVRRWMLACKVAEYDVALLYLAQAEWDLAAAVAAYQDDERWENEHPLEARRDAKTGKTAKTVGMRRFVGGEPARTG